MIAFKFRHSHPLFAFLISEPFIRIICVVGLMFNFKLRIMPLMSCFWNIHHVNGQVAVVRTIIITILHTRQFPCPRISVYFFFSLCLITRCRVVAFTPSWLGCASEAGRNWAWSPISRNGNKPRRLYWVKTLGGLQFKLTCLSFCMILSKVSMPRPGKCDKKGKKKASSSPTRANLAKTCPLICCWSHNGTTFLLSHLVEDLMLRFVQLFLFNEFGFHHIQNELIKIKQQSNAENGS